MKNSKKCKKNACKNNNTNSMNEAQLESVQGGTGAPAGWQPGDGARGKVIQPRVCKTIPPIDGKIQPR